MEEGSIRVSDLVVGKVRLDPAEIRGEGGEYDPRLVIPLTIELHQQSQEHQIVITRLSASLHRNEHPDHHNQFASTFLYDTLYNLPLRSVSNGTSTGRVDLCFSLTQPQLKALEHMRHVPDKHLYLHLDPMIAWNLPLAQNVDIQDEWIRYLGGRSQFAFFWLSSIGILRLPLAAMNWGENIFPGMGYDLFRLIEVKLPTSSTIIPAEAVNYFKKAKENYDRGAYVECLEQCRYVLDEVEKYLHPQKHELGGAIAQKLGWQMTPTLTEQARFLNSAWLSLYILANAAHHTPSRRSLLPADAHTALLVTAALLEYLALLE